MRLIAEFKDERQAFGFQAFLNKEGIPSVYDSSPTPTGEMVFRLWVVEEDDFDKAWAFYQEWQKNPQDVRFEKPLEKVVETPASPSAPKWKVRTEVKRPGFSFTLNNLIIILCSFIFVWNSIQEARMVEQRNGCTLLELTSIQKTLLFDYPQYFVNLEKYLEQYPIRTPEEIKELSPEAQANFKKVQDAPTWKGFDEILMTRSWKGYEELPSGTLFGKIREGEVWRLISPILLHANLLHILFNMAWVWVLGRQIEQRLGASRYLVLTLIIAIISNVAQYLMSGPVFAGYSGVVVGMVGFIWMRQKMAPWEGYPLQRPIVLFIAIFVLAMLGLEIVSMALQFFHITELYANIANTAHIIGGLTGILLARLPFFSRSRR